MTQQTDTEDTGSADTVFVLIGIALVALSAVVAGATVWYTVGMAALTEAVSPAAVGTVVFTLFVAIVFNRTSKVANRRITQKQ